MSVSIVAIKEVYEASSKVSAITCTMNMTFSKGKLAEDKFIVDCIIANDGNIMVNLASVFMIEPEAREATDDECGTIMVELQKYSDELKRGLLDEKAQQNILKMLIRVGIINESTVGMKNANGIKFSASLSDLNVTFLSGRFNGSTIKLTGEMLADGKFWANDEAPFVMVSPKERKLSKAEQAQVIAEIQKESRRVVFDSPALN
ncbi:MAG: hypothetical protein FWH37_01615 [Candidatus Bathyarchaeota archaeon]|nr:hypothetical protein [Candidatus Termiticorpusculum sp.]